MSTRQGPPSRRIRRSVLLCLRHERHVLLLVALLTVASLAVLPRARVSVDVVELLLEESDASAAYRQMTRDFGGGEIVVVAWPEPEPLGADALERLTELSRRLAGWPELASVASLATVPRVERREAGGLDVTTWAEALSTAGPDRREALLAQIGSVPELSGLNPRDADASVIVLALRALERMDFRSQSELVGRVRSTVRASGLPRETPVHVAGFPAAAAASLELVERAIGWLLPLTAGALLLTLWAVFRSLWPALLTVGIGTLAVLWGMAASVLYEPEISVPHSAAPIIVLVIATADVIFLASAFRRRRAAGQGRTRAAVAAAAQVAPACALTSVTTVLGFGSLLSVSVPAIRGLAVAAAVGVVSALTLVFTLGPLLLRRLPSTALTGLPRSSEALSSAVVRTGRFALRRPVWVVVAFGGLLLVGLARLPWLEIETDYVRRFPEQHPVRQAHAFAATSAGGTSTVQLVVRAAPREALRPPLVTATARLERELLEIDGVTSIVSVHSFLRPLHAILHPEEAGQYGLDEDRVRQALYFLPVVPEQTLAGMRTADGSAQRLTLRVAADGFQDLARLAAEIRELATERLEGRASVEVTGLEVLLGEWIGRVHASQLRGLAVAGMLIFGLFVWAFGSWRLAWVGLLLNAIPIVVLFAVLSLGSGHFDGDYLIVAMIGVGLAVDDTIHCLLAFRQRSRRGDVRAALETTLRDLGPPMVATTAVLVIGFLPLRLTGYLSLRMFSAELGAMLLIALAADLLLLPALLWLGSGRPSGVSEAPRGERGAAHGPC